MLLTGDIMGANKEWAHDRFNGLKTAENLIYLNDWRRCHGRASAWIFSSSPSTGRRACIDARASSVIPFTSRASASFAISDHTSAGIFPRARQLLTTDGETTSARATSEVPPSASISESGVMNAESAISSKIFTKCEGVKLHDKGMAKAWLAKHSLLMARRYEAIGKRLEMLRSGLGITQAELCRQIKCATNRWNQYEKGDRQITVAVANRLADEYGASLDWIYRDERRSLTQDLYARLYRAA